MRFLNFRTVLGALLAVSVFMLAYGLTPYVQEWYYRPLPIIPTGHAKIAERLMGCTQPFLPEAYAYFYGPADSEYGDLIVYGRITFVPEAGIIESDPLIWVFYPDAKAPYPFSESTYRIVTLPGKAPEYLSHSELLTRYPQGPCTPSLQELP